MRGKNIKSAKQKKVFIYIAVWILGWIAAWIVFIDYLPKHAHFDYLGLASPLLLLMLPFYGSQMTPDAFPLIIFPGVLFWIVTVVVFFIARKL